MLMNVSKFTLYTVGAYRYNRGVSGGLSMPLF